MKISRPIAGMTALLVVVPMAGLVSCDLFNKNGVGGSVSAKTSIVSVTPTATTAKALAPSGA